MTTDRCGAITRVLWMGEVGGPIVSKSKEERRANHCSTVRTATDLLISFSIRDRKPLGQHPHYDIFNNTIQRSISIRPNDRRRLTQGRSRAVMTPCARSTSQQAAALHCRIAVPTAVHLRNGL